MYKAILIQLNKSSKRNFTRIKLRLVYITYLHNGKIKSRHKESITVKIYNNLF